MNGLTANRTQLLLRNKVHSIIKNFELFFPDELEKTNIHKCKKCNGSGLNVIIGDSGITFWDPGVDNVCSDCGGFGYSVKQLNGEWLCKKCKGLGCPGCGGTGTIDWVTRVMGGS